MTVLVATSGDTGSAVAQGFHGVEGIDVVLLYPKGRISRVQEQQLTTVGGNVQALEVEGAFDDCQTMVKSAFLDAELQAARPLTSANSINIARWIPQATTFASAVQRLGGEVIFSVPSGNYGNLAAGLLAHRMGMPCRGFVAATNVNRVVPEYLETGDYRPRPSIPTISNAMDVGAPSNFVRLTPARRRRPRGPPRHGPRLPPRATPPPARGSPAGAQRPPATSCDPHGAIGHQLRSTPPLQRRPGTPAGSTCTRPLRASSARWWPPLIGTDTRDARAASRRSSTAPNRPSPSPPLTPL